MLPPQYSTPGVIMGTVGYMSPEQAQGRVNQIDHRSDIFSFGCLLFETVTRRKPFEGQTTLDSLHNTVHATTPNVKEWYPEAPDDLQRIIRRCLAKDPDRRYQSMREVAIELEELWPELRTTSERDSLPGGVSESRTQTEVSAAIRKNCSTTSTLRSACHLTVSDWRFVDTCHRNAKTLS